MAGHNTLDVRIYVRIVVPEPIFIMKICFKCNLEKEFKEFSFRNKRKGTYHSYCKTCHRSIRNKFYKDNSHERERIAKAKIDKTNISKEYIKNLKINAVCHKCGYNKPSGLQFHHLKDKEINICNAVINGWTLTSIQKEIDKCEIICSNCHMEEHFGYLYK